MITSFSKMDKSSRVWIYQSNRKLIDFELKEIEESLCLFLNNWTAHGSELQTAYQMKYNRFILYSSRLYHHPYMKPGKYIDDLYRLNQMFFVQ